MALRIGGLVSQPFDHIDPAAAIIGLVYYCMHGDDPDDTANLHPHHNKLAL